MDTGTETGTARASRRGRQEEGNGKRGGGLKRGGASGAGAKKGARWSGMCRHTGQSTSGTVPIRFGTYNICNRRNGSLYSALRGMFQDNMDLGIFQEMK